MTTIRNFSTRTPSVVVLYELAAQVAHVLLAENNELV
jgi:hypothetical protein